MGGATSGTASLSIAVGTPKIQTKGRGRAKRPRTTVNTMLTNKATKETYTETRKEFAKRYFLMMPNAYSFGNMGLITVLSDLQEFLGMTASGETAEHYRRALNDIKCVLSEDSKREREAEGRS